DRRLSMRRSYQPGPGERYCLLAIRRETATVQCGGVDIALAPPKCGAQWGVAGIPVSLRSWSLVFATERITLGRFVRIGLLVDLMAAIAIMVVIAIHRAIR
ncbi:MAG: hypothetical protein WCJ30_29080, partial [Deltaproteobacteria bacterium]